MLHVTRYTFVLIAKKIWEVGVKKVCSFFYKAIKAKV
jgi:hypothetical protein